MDEHKRSIPAVPKGAGQASRSQQVNFLGRTKVLFEDYYITKPIKAYSRNTESAEVMKVILMSQSFSILK